MKNNIEDIKILEEFIDGLKQYNPKTGKDIKPTQFGEGQRYVYSNVYYAIDHILSDYKRVLKENECLKNHIHYKNCIACGKEFKSKRDDAKYCIKCSKQIANKNYIANLTEEQKLKRREQAKLAMRKLRANRK